ncbi:MAG: hypothetical protein ACXVCP_15705 [Bdellovibrio sp.]
MTILGHLNKVCRIVYQRILVFPAPTIAFLSLLGPICSWTGEERPWNQFDVPVTIAFSSFDGFNSFRINTSGYNNDRLAPFREALAYELAEVLGMGTILTLMQLSVKS